MAAPEGVFLDAAHEILVDAIGSRLHDGLREPCEMSVADFDEVKYKLVVLSESTHVVTLNIAMPCAAALKTLGLAKTLSDTYPGMETTPEDGFDVAVQLDLNNVTDATATLSKLTLLRRNLIGTPFTQVSASTRTTWPIDPARANKSLPAPPRARASRRSCATNATLSRDSRLPTRRRL